MYSRSWFTTFAANVPARTTAAEVAAVRRLAPLPHFARVLDVGCGTGRTAVPLSSYGYHITGIDISVAALQAARRAGPALRLVALDQRHVGRLRWTFDAALVLWNSIGFATRADDLTTLEGLHAVLRPGGVLLLDMYHPGWLAAHEQRQAVDARGATVDRWLRDGRSHHHIRYADGGIDSIEFNVYDPQDLADAVRAVGFVPAQPLVWWGDALQAGPDHARYQVACTRP